MNCLACIWCEQEIPQRFKATTEWLLAEPGVDASTVLERAEALGSIVHMLAVRTVCSSVLDTMCPTHSHT